MPRRPLDYLTALSTLLLGVWLLLCLLSCGVPAGSDFRAGGAWHGFALRDGELLVWSHLPATPRNKKAFPYVVMQDGWEWGDIAVRSGGRPGKRVGWELTIPFWVTTSVVGVLPACRLVTWRHRATRARARIIRSLCHVCGYDLRGSVNHTCPECGTMKWPDDAILPLRT